jgi:hypothetical protein
MYTDVKKWQMTCPTPISIFPENNTYLDKYKLSIDFHTLTGYPQNKVYYI